MAGFAIAFSDSSAQAGLGANQHVGLLVVTAGLVLQLTTLVIALVFLLVIFVRAARAYRVYGYTTFHSDAGYVRLTLKFRLFLAVLPVACFCIFSRLIYKIGAFSHGLTVGMAMDEGLFNGFEGLVLGYAMASLTLCYPAMCLEDGKRIFSDKERLLEAEAAKV